MPKPAADPQGAAAGRMIGSKKTEAPLSEKEVEAMACLMIRGIEVEMFEDMTCTTTKINVLFMDVDQSSICLGTKKDASDVTQFFVENIQSVRPKEPQNDPANKAVVEIVHDEGVTHFKVDTNRSRDILSTRLSVLVQSLVEKKKFHQGPPPSAAGRPTLQAAGSRSGSESTISPNTPGVKSCNTPGTLGMMKSTKPRNGYRIINLRKNSPAEKLGLQSFDDVVIAVDGLALEVPPGSPAVHFSTHLKDKMETRVVLTMFNSKTACSRDVTIIPSRRWISFCFIGINSRYDPLVSSEVLLPV